MSVTAAPDTTTISEVDLHAEVPCARFERCQPTPHAADYLMRFKCPTCGWITTVGVCSDLWGILGVTRIVHGPCGADFYRRDECCRIVEVLR